MISSPLTSAFLIQNIHPTITLFDELAKADGVHTEPHFMQYNRRQVEVHVPRLGKPWLETPAISFILRRPLPLPNGLA